MTQQLIGGKFSATYPDASTGALKPAVGYKLYTYISGTTTNKTTWSDSALSVTNQNPITLDARGEASIFLGSGAYTLVLKSATGSTIWTRDGVSQATSSVDLAAPTGSDQIGNTRTGTGAVPATVKTEFDRLAVNVEQFGAVAGQNSHQAFMDAINYIAARSTQGGELIVPNRSSPFLVGGLTIPAMYRLKVRGEAHSKIELLAGANTSMFTPHQDTFLMLNEVYLDGNKAAQTGGTSHIINLPQATGGSTYKYGASIHKCMLLRAQNHGVNAEAYRSLGHISESLIEDSGGSALDLQAVDWEINDAQFGHSGSHNIIVRGNNDFLNCDVYGAGGNGIEVLGLCQQFNFVNGMINGNMQHGVNINTQNDATVPPSLSFSSTNFASNGQALANTYSNFKVENSGGVRLMGCGFIYDYAGAGVRAMAKYHVEVVSALSPVMLLGVYFDPLSRATSDVSGAQYVMEISNRIISFPSNFSAVPFARSFGNLVTDVLQSNLVNGDAASRYYQRADGAMFWGDGTNAQDTRLSRVSPNVLAMGAGDHFQVDGVWNAGMMRIGNNYLWVDGSARLRIKASIAPTSDTDGTVVGTQS